MKKLLLPTLIIALLTTIQLQAGRFNIPKNGAGKPPQSYPNNLEDIPREAGDDLSKVKSIYNSLRMTHNPTKQNYLLALVAFNRGDIPAAWSYILKTIQTALLKNTLNSNIMDLFSDILDALIDRQINISSDEISIIVNLYNIVVALHGYQVEARQLFYLIQSSNASLTQRTHAYQLLRHSGHIGNTYAYYWLALVHIQGSAPYQLPNTHIREWILAAIRGGHPYAPRLLEDFTRLVRFSNELMQMRQTNMQLENTTTPASQIPYFSSNPNNANIQAHIQPSNEMQMLTDRLNAAL